MNSISRNDISRSGFFLLEFLLYLALSGFFVYFFVNFTIEYFKRSSQLSMVHKSLELVGLATVFFEDIRNSDASSYTKKISKISFNTIIDDQIYNTQLYFKNNKILKSLKKSSFVIYDYANYFDSNISKKTYYADFVKLNIQDQFLNNFVFIVKPRFGRSL